MNKSRCFLLAPPPPRGYCVSWLAFLIPPCVVQTLSQNVSLLCTKPPNSPHFAYNKVYHLPCLQSPINFVPGYLWPHLLSSTLSFCLATLAALMFLKLIKHTPKCRAFALTAPCSQQCAGKYLTSGLSGEKNKNKILTCSIFWFLCINALILAAFKLQTSLNTELGRDECD